MLDWVGNTQLFLVLNLEVVAINKKPHRLYEKFGFEEEGRLKNGVKSVTDMKISS